MPENLYRIIDANLNRASEGLRVVEEVARFILEKEELSGKAKAMRHLIAKGANTFPLEPGEFIIYRDAQGDIGANLVVPSEKERSDFKSVISANIKRVQQASRVLEEFGKVISPEAAEIFKEVRYGSYTLEKEILNYYIKKPAIELYVIISEELSVGRSVIQVAAEAIAGGAQAIQLREKNWPVRQLLEVGKEIRKLTSDKKVLFIMNDRVDVAIAVDADGVHLGQDDMPFQEAKRILGPGKIIGLSTHSLEQAIEAQKLGADYIGVGPVYPTNSKADLSPIVGLDLVSRVSKNVTIPFVAIGGINKNNVEQVIKAGAPGIAVITAVTGAKDITGAAKELNDQIRKAGSVKNE